MRFQFPDFDNTSSFANYVAKKININYILEFTSITFRSFPSFFRQITFQICPRSNFEKREGREMKHPPALHSPCET